MAFGPNPPPIQAHICVVNGEAAIKFYAMAFGAACTFSQKSEDNQRILHANLEIFGSEIMLHDEFPEWPVDVLSPNTRGGASVAININLPAPQEVDAIVERACRAGAEITSAPEDQFWGSRYGRIRDPFGHIWAFNAPISVSSGK